MGDAVMGDAVMGDAVEGSARGAGGAVHRLGLAPVKEPDPRMRRTFDEARRTLSELFDGYVSESVSLDLVAHGREGANLDVGEILEFDVRIGNHGSLPLADVRVEVVARRGGVSDKISRAGTSWDPRARRCAIEWMAPWDQRLGLVLPRLEPGQTAQGAVPAFLGGDASCRRVFAYRAHEPTAGVDNDRDVETLVAARIVRGRLGDLDPFDVEAGPVSAYESFVQRS